MTSASPKPLTCVGSSKRDYLRFPDQVQDDMATPRSEIEMQDASENIFVDLGCPAAAEHYVKAQLVFHMQHIMKARKLTQSAAAALMGIKQPDVSNMIRGRFRGYSIDRIFSFLQALDQDIEIVIKPKASQEQAARIIVKAV